jgi:hypothetical protein
VLLQNVIRNSPLLVTSLINRVLLRKSFSSLRVSTRSHLSQPRTGYCPRGHLILSSSSAIFKRRQQKCSFCCKTYNGNKFSCICICHAFMNCLSEINTAAPPPKCPIFRAWAPAFNVLNLNCSTEFCVQLLCQQQ